MLPAQQEPDEVAGRDRLDLAPLALPGVRVDAGQHPPGAPLLGSVRVGEPAAQREALVLQPDQGQRHVRHAQRRRPGQLLRRDRPRHVQVPAQHLRRRGLGVHGLDPRQGRHREGPRGGVQAGENRHPFGSTPQPGRQPAPPARPPRARRTTRPTPAAAASAYSVISRSCSSSASRGCGRTCVPDPLDRVRVEPGQVAGLHRQPAAERAPRGSGGSRPRSRRRGR